MLHPTSWGPENPKQTKKLFRGQRLKRGDEKEKKGVRPDEKLFPNQAP